MGVNRKFRESFFKEVKTEEIKRKSLLHTTKQPVLSENERRRQMVLQDKVVRERFKKSERKIMGNLTTILKKIDLALNRDMASNRNWDGLRQLVELNYYIKNEIISRSYLSSIEKNVMKQTIFLEREYSYFLAKSEAMGVSKREYLDFVDLLFDLADDINKRKGTTGISVTDKRLNELNAIFNYAKSMPTNKVKLSCNLPEIFGQLLYLRMNVCLGHDYSTFLADMVEKISSHI
ncbi:MAG: hypothetical protein PHQ98_04450 [Candidatus ainarchaeum sp.]|nr:hypothetical protein [Candidatus ainarchaeum sp.]